MVYIIVFIISIVFAKLADNSEERCISWCYLALSALPLIVFAGFRDDEIGTDTSLYPLVIHTIIDEGFSLSDILDYSTLVEPLYSSFIYYTYYVFGSEFSTFLFIQHFLIVGCFYIASYRLRQFVSLPQSVFMFCFLFYNMSLNIQRQSIALCIVYLGYSFLVDNKLRVFIISVLIGFFFHKTAIMGLFLIPIMYVEETKYNIYYILGTILVLVLYSIVLDYFLKYTGLDKYEQYMDNSEFEGAFSNSEFILRLVFLTIFLYAANSEKLATYYNALTLFVCEFFLNLLQIKSAFVGRIALYAYILYIVYLPNFCFKNDDEEDNVPAILVTNSMIVIYWLFVYVISEAGSTYPYKSQLLEII
ncbi:MAG: EpsG family protein [Prevotella sp.]|nr:EpsG family protein [Prevotella sp.]